MTAQQPARTASEEDSLLSGRPQPRSMRTILNRFSWNAHPFWLIPVVLVMSMSRGVTMSPRIQVYKAIACRSLYTDAPPDLHNILTLVDKCGSPEVNARVAYLQASVVTTMSALSAISTGFWSRLGDTHGRKLILCTFLTGALLMEAVFLLVMRPQSIFGQYAEQFILVGPILEGFVGGLSTFNGVVHAYISDCTRHGSRSTIFSTVQGVVFVGLAIGPWLDGIFLPPKGYDDRFFIGSISLIAATILYVIFICPESREPDHSGNTSRFRTGTLMKDPVFLTAKRLMSDFISALLLPISMFKPRPIPGSRKKNYNMTLCGLGLFLYIVSTGVYSAKYIYAQQVYQWDTAELGYYMSTLWITRAINLLLFLPIVLSYLKPKSTTPRGSKTSNPHDIAAEMRFDKHLAQISLAVDGLADSLVALTQSRSQPIFYALSCLSSFTSGGNPALHSLGAVCLHACGYSSEVGALFGAMGVLSAIGHIMSPYIYSTTYGKTNAYFPEAIFVLGASLLFTVVFLLSQLSFNEEDISLVHTPRIGDQPSSSTPSASYSYQALSNTTDVDEELDERQR